MAQTNSAATITTANGVAKRVFGKLQDLIPGNREQFIRRVKLDKDNLVGAEYQEPVFLTGEHGATWTGNGGAGATLNGAEVAISAPATINPYSMWFQARVVIDSAARMLAAGEASFANYITVQAKNTRKAVDKRLEIMHVNSKIGIASSGSGTTTLLMSFGGAGGQWSPHAWLGLRNCHVNAYTTAGVLLNTDADLVVTKVDPKNKQITFTADASDGTAIAAATNPEFYFLTQFGNQGVSLRDICTLSSGDTLFGIASATYNDVWAATQVTWNGTDEFTWELLQNGIEEAVGRGLERDLNVFVPFPVWTSLNSSIDALRVFDSSASVSKIDMGHDEDAISYRSLGVKMKIIPSGYVFEKEVLCFADPTMDTDSLKLVGSTPGSFQNPLKGEGEMVYHVQGTNMMEWCYFTNQSLFTTAPRDFVYFGTAT